MSKRNPEFKFGVEPEPEVINLDLFGLRTGTQEAFRFSQTGITAAEWQRDHPNELDQRVAAIMEEYNFSEPNEQVYQILSRELARDYVFSYGMLIDQLSANLASVVAIQQAQLAEYPVEALNNGGIA